jgi:hypothetical protein
MAAVEEAVRERQQWARTDYPPFYPYYEHTVSTYASVESFYIKVLAHRRKRFNQMSNSRNLSLLRQAIYAHHIICKDLDYMRICEYNEKQYPTVKCG